MNSILTVLVLCNFTTDFNKPIQRLGKVLDSNINLCQDDKHCTNGMLVIFNDSPVALIVPENDCLYTKEIK